MNNQADTNSSLKTIINFYRNKITTWWNARDAREKKFLLIGSVATVIIILFIVVQSIIGGYIGLWKSLPILRKNYAISELYSSKILSQTGTTTNNIETALKQSLESFTTNAKDSSDKVFSPPRPKIINGKNAFIININNGKAKVVFNWLATLSKKYNLTVIEVNITTGNDKKISGNVVVGKTS